MTLWGYDEGPDSLGLCLPWLAVFPVLFRRVCRQPRRPHHQPATSGRAITPPSRSESGSGSRLIAGSRVGAANGCDDVNPCPKTLNWLGREGGFAIYNFEFAILKPNIETLFHFVDKLLLST